MFECFFVKRKLYDYIDNSLSEEEKIRVKAHLDVCLDCREKIKEMESLIRQAQKKNIPQPSDDFWHNFKTELDQKLNQKLVPEFNLKGGFTYHLRPVFVLPLACVFIVAITIYFYLQSRPVFLAKEDTDLIEEMNFWEEIAPGSLLNDNEESFTEELDNFYRLDQNPT